MSITLTKRLDKGDKLTVVEHDTNLTNIENGVNGNETAVNSHVNDKANPHEVTMAKLGFPLIQNIAPLDMPISTNMQDALDGIQLDLDTFKARKDNPHEVTMTQLGFPLVQNIAPLDMPISTAQGAVNTQLQNNIDSKEDSLGNPPQDGYVLVKNSDGTVIWTDTRDLNAYDAESILIDTDNVILTYDLENKLPTKIPVVVARKDFEIRLENINNGVAFQYIFMNDTDNNISIKVPPFLSLVNGGGTGQVSRWSLDRRTNTINEGVNLSNNLMTVYIWTIIKVNYPYEFAIESLPNTKTGQDFYGLSIGEWGNVSFFNQ